MNILAHLRRQFEQALAPLTDRPAEYAQHVRPAQDPKFGDYQANCAMPLRSEIGGKPREIAERIIAGLPDRSIYSSIEVAGPGFINLRLSDAFLSDRLAAALADPNLGIDASGRGRTVVIDYSSPNVAKPMHVGHLRSTIIGDAIARVHRALGWTVHADNHLGDWGTQFGMLIHGWRDEALRQQVASGSCSELETLARLYIEISQRAERDPAVAEAARRETARLHQANPENLALWQRFMPLCLAEIRRVYDRLGITFDHYLGESFYQPILADLVDELLRTGIGQESQGAACVFFPDPTGKLDDSGQPISLMPPAIVRKADGAFTYATSDVACIRYRVDHFHPELIVYVVDDRQSLHFQQIFETARRMGYTDVGLVHVAFGKIMGKDGRPFRTREGGIVGLDALLDEAVARARAIVDQESGHLPAHERARIAEVVGIGAVKYADLSQNRLSDYVFDWDKMISMTGNTATYLQYAYARNRGIFRKGEIDPSGWTEHPPRIRLEGPYERALAVELLRFPETIDHTASELRPNLLTNHLFELADTYTRFYDQCSVLKAPSEELRASRLALCELTARTLRKGLELLGIEVLDRM